MFRSLYHIVALVIICVIPTQSFAQDAVVPKEKTAYKIVDRALVSTTTRTHVTTTKLGAVRDPHGLLPSWCVDDVAKLFVDQKTTTVNCKVKVNVFTKTEHAFFNVHDHFASSSIELSKGTNGLQSGISVTTGGVSQTSAENISWAVIFKIFPWIIFGVFVIEATSVLWAAVCLTVVALGWGAGAGMFWLTGWWVACLVPFFGSFFASWLLNSKDIVDKQDNPLRGSVRIIAGIALGIILMVALGKSSYYGWDTMDTNTYSLYLCVYALITLAIAGIYEYFAKGPTKIVITHPYS